MLCICIINDCPKPILFTLYRTPRPISHTLYRMGVFFEGRIIYSLNLKSVTVGKIWLQQNQINHKIKILQNIFQIFGIVMAVYNY